LVRQGSEPEDFDGTLVFLEAVVAITELEKLALERLADAWNAFVASLPSELSDADKDDLNDFRFHIHSCQRLVALASDEP
jgi:hypothetical protein